MRGVGAQIRGDKRRSPDREKNLSDEGTAAGYQAASKGARTPREPAQLGISYTGQYLKELLTKRPGKKGKQAAE